VRPRGGLTRNVTLSSRRTPGQNARGYFRVGSLDAAYENISREREKPRRRPFPSAFRRFVHRFVRRARVRARVIDFLIEPVASSPMHPAGEEEEDGGGKEKGKKKPRRHVVYVEFRNVAREDRVGPNESSRARAQTRSLHALDLFSFLPPRKVSGDITARTAGLASNAFSLTRGIRIRAHARASAGQMCTRG